MQCFAILTTNFASPRDTIREAVYIDPGQEPELLDLAYATPLDALRDGWRLLNAPQRGDNNRAIWWLVRDPVVLNLTPAQDPADRWASAFGEIIGRLDAIQKLDEPPKEEVAERSAEEILGYIGAYPTNDPTADQVESVAWLMRECQLSYSAAAHIARFAPEILAQYRELSAMWTEESSGAQEGGPDDLIVYRPYKGPKKYRGLVPNSRLIVFVGVNRILPETFGPERIAKSAATDNGTVYSICP